MQKLWQNIQKKITSYIRIAVGTITSWNLQLQIQKEKKLYKLYTTVKTLPLARFFDILESNDYRYLIKLDNYDELPKIKMDLSETWYNIYEDYLIKTKNPEYRFQFLERKEIDLLIIEHEKLSYAVWVASVSKLEQRKIHEGVDKFLKSKGLDTNNNESFINKSQSKIKSLEYKIKLRNDRLKELTTNKNVQSDYLNIIDDIEKYKGHQIDLEKTTVYQFISYINGLKTENGRRKNPQGRHIKR